MSDGTAAGSPQRAAWTNQRRRVVVADDGRTIKLTVYDEAVVLAVIELDPVRAVSLAVKLLKAAEGRLMFSAAANGRSPVSLQK